MAPGFGLQINGTEKTKRGITEDINFRTALPLQVAAEREIARLLSGNPALSWDVGFEPFAHPAILPLSIVGASSPIFLLVAGMFSLTSEVYAIVSERKNRLRQALSTMGMIPSAYWASYIFYEVVFTTLTSLLTTLFGMAFQFDLFLKNGFGVVWLLFWCYELAIIGVVFLFSSIVAEPASSYMLGLLFVLIGFLMQLSVVFGFPFTDQV